MDRPVALKITNVQKAREIVTVILIVRDSLDVENPTVILLRDFLKMLTAALACLQVILLHFYSTYTRRQSFLDKCSHMIQNKGLLT